MNQKNLYVLWGVLFALCAGLGFIPEPEGALRVLLVLLALGFFVPPYLLLYRAAKLKDLRTLALLRNLAAASLLVTLVTLIANFFSVLASETVGAIAHSVLVIVSSPMICGQYWVVSLFLWAFLMIAAMTRLKKPRKSPRSPR